MKSFIELFTAARRICTPLVMIRTADGTSAINTIRPTLEKAPVISWNCCTGATGLNDTGTAELTKLLAATGLEQGATAAFPVFLGLLRSMKPGESDLVAFALNTQLQFAGQSADAIQGVLNLRDPFKASGAMLVLLEGTGDELPVELLQHTLTLDQPLPTRDELATVVTETFKFASQSPKGEACKKGPSPEVVKQATDAGIGLPMFPFEQSIATCLDVATGKLDIDTLWERKKDIVSANPGLSYHKGSETLADMYGCESWVKFGTRFMNGPYRPTIIVRMDEIQRQLAGSESDSSGTKGNLMGEFLTWVNDKKVVCTLNLGVSGTSKSWGPYCLGGQYGIPIVNYSVSAMEHKHVGESSRHMRTAHRVLESISDCNIWLIASANSLDGLPPELISRFQKGGIFFFDLPDEAEKQGILDLKIKMYGLDPDQTRPEMPSWTGRDIDNCCGRAQLLGISLVEAAKDIIPLHQSHTEMIENIRTQASNKYLSASKPGTFQYIPAIESEIGLAEPVVSNGRRIR